MKKTMHGRALVWISFLWTACQPTASKPSSPPLATTANSKVAPIVVHTTKVMVGEAKKQIIGLGSVTALYTTTVKAQVDGRLKEVLFHEGDTVAAGDLLARLDLRPYEYAVAQAEATLQRDEAIWRNGVLNLHRFAALSSNHLLPESQVTDQNALVQQYHATVEMDRAALATAQLNLEYAHIRAPIGGVLGARLIDPGNLVHATDVNGLVVIATVNPITVLFNLPQAYLPQVQRALRKTPQLPVVAFSREQNEVLAQGFCYLLDNQMNASTGTMRLKAIFKNDERLLWPNQFVKVALTIEHIEHALLLPSGSVQSSDSESFVYRIDDQQAKRQVIQVEAINDEQTMVLSGLQAGDEVVTDSQTPPDSEQFAIVRAEVATKHR